MHKTLALILVAVMLVPSGVVAQAVQAGVWDTVQGLPAGTRLKLAMSNGDEVTGTVVGTTTVSVVMRQNEAGPTGFRTREGASLNGDVTFDRSNVSGATVVKMANRYGTSAVPDSTALRHVLAELGVNRKVNLRTSTQRIRGRIQSLGPASFTIEHGLRSRTEEIQFSEVREIKPAGLHGAAKAGIIAGAAFGALVLMMLQCYASGRCVS